MIKKISKDIVDEMDEAKRIQDEYDDLECMVGEHWRYVSSICEKMYKDAFKHGYKHGKEDKND
tara:strand:- start:411 stop:599 length:189 start_codon:yes stop_codon:yes gene_type:complete